MGRKTIPQETKRDVLMDCRRRCCICFGLNRDTSIKRGQIAHLDGDTSHNDPDNLAFLCLDHHDELDTRTSQSKGLTIAEVKEFRSELQRDLEDALNQPVSFGEAETSPYGDDISGRYIQEGEDYEAELQVNTLPGDRVAVEGLAFRWAEPGKSAHISNVSFESTVNSGTTVHRDDEGGLATGYELRLEFDGDQIRASEKGHPPFGGEDVNFEGKYTRVGSASSSST